MSNYGGFSSSNYNEKSSSDKNNYHSEYSTNAESRATHHLQSRMESSMSQQSSSNYTASDCIGFHELPNRQHYKNARRGYPFTLAVVGESGLGKSTLIESLFLAKLYDEANDDNEQKTVNERIGKDVSVEPITLEIEESGVKVKLTIVDLPGYGDRIDGKDQFKEFDTYIGRQFQQYYTDENGLNRKNLQDYRVHAVLYFINPTGRGLKPIDIEFIKHFQDKVNIIPIIAKADMLTVQERETMKQNIRAEVEHHKLKVYSHPQTMDSDDLADPKYLKQTNKYRQKWPFAVIGSMDEFKINGQLIRGRQYPWGIVNILDENHSDFSVLRSLLVGYMLELVDITHDIHYEKYREMRMFNNETNKLHGSQYMSGDGHHHHGGYTSSVHGPMGDGYMSSASLAPSESVVQEKDEEIRKLREQMERMQHQLFNSGNGKVSYT